jgi:hypothetical protein
MKDFFVSYNHADRAWAEWIEWQLEALVPKTVIQAWGFRRQRPWFGSDALDLTYTARPFVHMPANVPARA